MKMNSGLAPQVDGQPVYFCLEMTEAQIIARFEAALRTNHREGLFVRPPRVLPNGKPALVIPKEVVYPSLARGKITLPEVADQTHFVIGSERL